MKPVSISHLHASEARFADGTPLYSFSLSDADAVMKNPFYTPEMPINATGFDTKMNAIVAAAGP
jgi:hypothetical protein